DVISVTPAMRPSARSSGVATLAAIVLGLAPGSSADTLMVGTFTSGSEAIGKRRQANAPAITSPRHSSDVATGRLMKGPEIFMPPSSHARFCTRRGICSTPPQHAFEREIDHRCGEQRQQLAYEQAPEYAHTERVAQFRSHAAAQHQRQRAQHC